MSHRLFYEGVSFHWHEKGKCHLLYNPTFQVSLPAWWPENYLSSCVALTTCVAMTTYVAMTTCVAMPAGGCGSRIFGEVQLSLSPGVSD